MSAARIKHITLGHKLAGTAALSTILATAGHIGGKYLQNSIYDDLAQPIGIVSGSAELAQELGYLIGPDERIDELRQIAKELLPQDQATMETYIIALQEGKTIKQTIARTKIVAADNTQRTFDDVVAFFYEQIPVVGEIDNKPAAWVMDGFTQLRKKINPGADTTYTLRITDANQSLVYAQRGMLELEHAIQEEIQSAEFDTTQTIANAKAYVKLHNNAQALKQQIQDKSYFQSPTPKNKHVSNINTIYTTEIPKSWLENQADNLPLYGFIGGAGLGVAIPLLYVLARRTIGAAFKTNPLVRLGITLKNAVTHKGKND